MIRHNEYYFGRKAEEKSDIDLTRFKELRVYTPDGIKSFDTRGLVQAEGYGTYTKNRIEKVIKRIFSKSGILKFSNGEKIDLTMQTKEPVIVYKD